MTTLLSRELVRNGYLTLTKFVKYLKETHPEAYVSYPTALKLVNNGGIKGMRIGNQWRILRTEVDRWVAEGNWERDLTSSPYPKS